MCRKTLIGCAVLFAVVGVCVCANTAMANTLLFADNFNSSIAANSSDVNSGLDGRRSGKYSSTTYNVQNYVALFGSASGNYGNLQVGTDALSRGDAIVGQDFSGTDAAGGLDVTLRARPTSDGAADWVGLVIGNNGTDSPPSINNGLLVAFRGNGEVFLRGYIPALGYNDTMVTKQLGYTDAFHDFHIQITGVGDSNPFDSVGGLRLRIFADNNEAPDAVLDYTTSNVYSANYMGLLGSANALHLVDNLSISQVTTTPEPGTMVLLSAGLLGLLAYAWRKLK